MSSDYREPDPPATCRALDDDGQSWPGEIRAWRRVPDGGSRSPATPCSVTGDRVEPIADDA